MGCVIRRLLKLCGLIRRDQRLDNIIHIPVQKRIQLVKRTFDPVICDPSLWKIIGADLFRPVACPDLAAPLETANVSALMSALVGQEIPATTDQPGLTRGEYADALTAFVQSLQ